MTVLFVMLAGLIVMLLGLVMCISGELFNFWNLAEIGVKLTTGGLIYNLLVILVTLVILVIALL